MTDQLSENHKMTIAMAAIQRRFSETQMETAVITCDEFGVISNYIESLEHEIQMLACENHSLLSQKIQPEDYQIDSREVLDKHLDTRPGCGGVADNGHDRSWSEPNPYFCTKCQEDDEVIYIPDKYEQERQAVRMRWDHLNDMRNHKLVVKSGGEI